MRWTIGLRLWVGFVVVIALLTLLCVVNGLGTRQIRSLQAHMLEEEELAMLFTEKLTDHYRWLDGLNQTFLKGLAGIEVQTDPTQCGLGQFLASEQARDLIEHDPKAEAILAAIIPAHERLHASATTIDQAWRAGRHDDARDLAQGPMRAVLADVQTRLVEMKEHLIEEAKVESELMGRTVARVQQVNLTLWLLATLLGVASAWWITRGIVRPISRLVAVMGRVSQSNDLTQDVDIQRRDELGTLAEGFNMVLKTLRSLLGEVQEASREVAGAATEIAASSEQIAQGTREQASQLTQVSSAITEMSASVAEVAGKSSDAAKAAEGSGKLAQQGGMIVEGTIEGMNAINQAVANGAESVRQLGQRGEQIGKIIDVIKDIADQTNLLALNAAIEAARAGEHGRGFAVVADEVRKLADRTSVATDEIAQSIDAIQRETSQAVGRMNDGTTQVNAGVEKAMQAGQSLREIVQSAGHVTGLVQSIAAAAEQQSAASEEISQTVESIDQLTRQSAQGVEQSAAAGAQLSRKAEHLQRLVSRFVLTRS